MLALTTKSKYGIAALLHLASGFGGGLLQIKDLAGHQGIPRNYLVQVMNGLITAGLVKTVRGKRGGYTLSRSPEQITLYEAFEALEGPLELRATGPEDPVVSELLQKAESGLRHSLRFTIAEILVLQKENASDFTFQI